MAIYISGKNNEKEKGIRGLPSSALKSKQEFRKGKHH